MAPHDVTVAAAVTLTSTRCQKLSSQGKYLLTRCCSTHTVFPAAAGPSWLLGGNVRQ